MKKIKNLSNKKLIIMTIVALIISVVLEIILTESGVHDKVQIAVGIYHFGLIWFFCLHFVANLKNLYDYIIDNRFVLAIILTILSTIVGFFMTSPMMSVIDWITKIDVPLNLIWNIEFFGFLLVAFETFRIIINKNDYMSVIASVVVVLSSSVQYNMGKSLTILLGLLIFVLFSKILENRSNSKKYLIPLNIGFILSIAAYGISYSPYAKSFIYLVIALIIWKIVENYKELKKDKKTIIMISVSTLIGIVLVVIENLILKMNYETVGLRFNGMSYLMSYLYGVALPYVDLNYKSSLASFISLFPIPMLLALYYVYKNEKNTIFLFIMAMVSSLATIYCMVELPSIIQKIFLFNNVSNVDMLPVVQISNILILFYFCGNIKEEIFNVKISMRITIILMILILFIQYPSRVIVHRLEYLYIAIASALAFLFLNFGDRKYKKVLMFMLIATTLACGLPINLFI